MTVPATSLSHSNIPHLPTPGNPAIQSSHARLLPPKSDWPNLIFRSSPLDPITSLFTWSPHPTSAFQIPSTPASAPQKLKSSASLHPGNLPHKPYSLPFTACTMSRSPNYTEYYTDPSSAPSYPSPYYRAPRPRLRNPHSYSSTSPGIHYPIKPSCVPRSRPLRLSTLASKVAWKRSVDGEFEEGALGRAVEG